ncbi:MAG: AMP-binding protein [Deltaproteobacteria bacterium]|nr:AMP-binding protein [Deltaproteobacteria bacterium]
MSAIDVQLSLNQIFNGRKIFLLGGTGFVGKVCLAMLLDRFANIGRIYLMVRAGSGTDSETRFWKDVVGSPVFDPLRARFGKTLNSLIEEKVRVVGGDITNENLGYSAEEAQAIADDIDVVINSSGKVTFNPALDQSLRTNVTGTKNILAFVKRMKRPALIHVSTCFVAGNRSATIWESEDVVGFFPRRDELEGTTFSVEEEIADCAKLTERVREEARDSVLAAELRKAARERLRREGRDPDNERYLKLAEARERKNWTRDRLSKLGEERALRWGWPNIYTYTKSLAEQLVAAEDGIVKTIVRPAIVESALKFPFPGWNEGFTTSAPIVFLALKGNATVPCSDRLILDIIPVDNVCAGILSAAAQAMVETPPLVYQLCSGDTPDPIRMKRMVTLLGLHKRRHFEQKETGNRALNRLTARMEVKAVTPEQFEHSTVPLLAKAAKRAQRLLDRVRPSWGGAHVADLVDNVRRRVDRIEQIASGVDDIFEVYRPFTVENHYEFRADNMRALHARIVEEERHLLPWDIDKIDWHHYLLDVHYPGLQRWVLPELEDDFAAQPKTIYTYNNLVELFDTSSKLHQHRVALRMERDGHRDQYTYGELQELATRVAGFLVENGIQAGQRVMLLSENRPEWPMAYFGVLKAGATCIPVDRESTTDELINIAKSGRPRGILCSEKQLEKHPQLAKRLAALPDDGPALWMFADAFAKISLEEHDRRRAKLPMRVPRDAPASLIYTSGTTGSPKGVQLTHRNFTFMVSELARVFEFGPRDGMLSVLPLHHTFEFAAGLLMPLSAGAQVSYLDELNSDSISDALAQGKTTAIVGVPALWDLLYRRIKNRLGQGPRWIELLLNGMLEFNSWIQKKSPFDLGRLLFMAVHYRFGGRIRYLISGGSSLADHVKKLFFGLGMPLLEGYGLTEASPVLTVTRPDDGLLLGTVGRPLPNVELQILNPDASGVGEVIARGHNVMAGYVDDPKATDATIREGWLHTGDLGYFDDDRNLYIVGRSKEVIVDEGGKNIYPDELEELYGDHELIKELSIVGIPDGSAERVGALVVPDYEHDKQLSRSEVQRRVEEHIRAVSADLPFYKRIKTLHLWDRELPRTATRKIRRREVVAELERLQKVVDSSTAIAATPKARTKEDWLLDVVAGVCNRPRARVTMSARFDELGFDSLLYTELAVAIEAAGGALTHSGDLTTITTMRELAAVVERSADSNRRTPSAEIADGDLSEELRVPAPIVELGRRVVGLGHRAAYNALLKTRIEGQQLVPQHCNFIVAPNHCSHADIGLVKHALGDAGRNLRTLAASDYFFDNRLKRALFDNFTNLVPMDRAGSLRKSLKRSTDLLEQGYNLLIFAEGTRSTDGQMTEFRSSLGYLAMRGRVGILPMYLEGTHDVLPKGSYMIKGRDVTARVGRLLSYEALLALTEGTPRNEIYRMVALATQRCVEALKQRQQQPSIETLRETLLPLLADGATRGANGSERGRSEDSDKERRDSTNAR